MIELSLVHLKYFIVNYVPIIIVAIFIIERYTTFRFPEKLFILPPLLVLSLMAMTLNGWLIGIPPSAFFNFNWRYENAILYGMYFFINWKIFYTKTRSFKTSALYATLSSIVVGWLYEIPAYLMISVRHRILFDSTFPFFISSRLIGAAFLFTKFKEVEYNDIKLIQHSLLFFIIFSIIWILTIPYKKRILPFLFMYRIPAMLLLTITAALYPIKGEEK